MVLGHQNHGSFRARVARSGQVVMGAGVAIALALVAGCPTVDLGENPVDPGLCRPDPSYFRDEIWPNYLAPTDLQKTCVGRSGCHAESDGRSALRLDTTMPIDMERNYRASITFLNCGSPDTSSFYTRPLAGEDSHGGGDIFTSADPQAAVFQGWF